MGAYEEMLAEKVIAAMQEGLCEPDEIYNRVLKDLNIARISEEWATDPAHRQDPVRGRA